MKIFKKMTAAAIAALTLVSGGLLTACSDDNDFSTQQYKGGVSLNVFGPCPVARGGELRFLGSGMNQITAISLPGSGDVTDIKVISNEEIRITVPQDAEEGKLTLRYSGGTIETKSEITYTEPISLDEMTPMSVKAGDKLTLKGDYLNLIHEVIFADEVIVPETDFTSHNRQEISLIVPAEAQTGKVIISDGAEIPNWIYSEEELQVVLPTVEKVYDLTDYKPGTVVVFTVKDLDLVKEVMMPNGETVEFTAEGDKLTFKLPANISDGTIVVIPASGVKVAIATIGVALPEEVKADPGVNIWAGDVIKFKGVNMELVTEVSFPNVADAVAPEEVASTEISVKVPEGTQSGNAVLHTASGGAVEVAISTLKPESVGFNPNPAALAAPVTVSGRNMQNVASITFNEDTTVEITDARADGFNVTIPATLSAGENTVTLTLTNGETVEAGSIELTAPECAYATTLPSEDVEIRAGETFLVTIANANMLTGVKVNNQNVQYILNEETLIIQVPKTARKNSNFTLVSSNGEISYYITVIPATHVGMTIWEGMWENTGWAGNQDLAWGGYDWTQVPAGATLTLYMTSVVPEGEWWCVSLRHGKDWGNLPDPIPGQYDNPENGVLSVKLPQNVLDDIIANGGLVISGSNFILNKVTIEWEISLETDVFGPIDQDLGSWTINFELKPNDAFITAGLQPGMTINFYCTPTSEWCQLQTFNGHWEGLTWAEASGTNNFNSGTHDMTKISCIVTPEIYTMLTTYIDWGYCMIVQGENLILNKITIE
ncbi:MAG: hypothetical protein NC311_12675 [Muribaculaceae bacterium]|nr:hypothetical protein [Muribaculaceae bacterium]